MDRQGGVEEEEFTVTIATENPSHVPIKAPQPSFRVDSHQVLTLVDTVTMTTMNLQMLD